MKQSNTSTKDLTELILLLKKLKPEQKLTVTEYIKVIKELKDKHNNP